jgi:O-acetyl-ADP-ribose deacetylase (regulator of RNase III)
MSRHKIEIVHSDITKLDVDAIVNAANSSLMGGGGVDGAIHRAAGPALKEYCSRLGGCPTGMAKTTPGFNLKAKFIIHTVGPVWNNGTAGEELLLQNCYENSLSEAVKNQCKTIAFPSISTGAYRFPFDKACKVALQTVDDFLKRELYIEKVLFAVFGERDLQRYQKIYDGFYS